MLAETKQSTPPILFRDQKAVATRQASSTVG